MLKIKVESNPFFVANLLHESEEGLGVLRTVPRKVGLFFGLCMGGLKFSKVSELKGEHKKNQSFV